MSEFSVRVVEITNVVTHPNADMLDITVVDGAYPVVIKRNQFKIGDTAIYIPIDSLVPVYNPCFSFLSHKAKNHNGEFRARIKALRLRDVFSMGLLIENFGDYELGKDDLADTLNIIKYEPPIDVTLGDCKKDHGRLPFYDLDGLRKYHNRIPQNTRIVITEKIHGTSSAYCFQSDIQQFTAKSHSHYRHDGNNLYWNIARKYNLPDILQLYPDLGVYGEIYGTKIQKGFNYGLTNDVNFAIFDLLDKNRWLSYEEVKFFSEKTGIPMVPVLDDNFLYDGIDSVKHYAEGNSTIKNSNHVREGIVIEPYDNSIKDSHFHRMKYKLHGEGYLLSKNS